MGFHLKKTFKLLVTLSILFPDRYARLQNDLTKYLTTQIPFTTVFLSTAHFIFRHVLIPFSANTTGAAPYIGIGLYWYTFVSPQK